MIVRIHWEFTINAFQNTWKIILVSHTRPLFRATKDNYFIGQLWQLLTASNVDARTEAWQAKWAVFKIPGVISHESLCASYMRSRFFLPCAYRLEVKYCWVLSVRYTISCYITNYKFRVHYTGVCLQAFPSFLPHPSPLFYLCHFSRGLWLSTVPRSLLLNRTETLAMQAIEYAKYGLFCSLNCKTHSDISKLTETRKNRGTEKSVLLPCNNQKEQRKQ